MPTASIIFSRDTLVTPYPMLILGKLSKVQAVTIARIEGWASGDVSSAAAQSRPYSAGS